MTDEDTQCEVEEPNSQRSWKEPGSLGSASADSYQPIHSLLLCPAQWTALLESSPISLVRQRDLRSVSPASNEEEDIEEDSVVKEEENETRLEDTRKPNTCKGEWSCDVESLPLNR